MYQPAAGRAPSSRALGGEDTASIRVAPLEKEELVDELINR